MNHVEARQPIHETGSIIFHFDFKSFVLWILIYFFGIEKGQYLPAWPVYVVHDDPRNLAFPIAVDDLQERGLDWALDRPMVMENQAEARREYVTRAFMQRAHQGRFRARVLSAYRRQCALCRLRHEELLDAAHIVGDKEPGGEPLVTNGIALCKLHHSAFDRHFIGITPEHSIEVRQDILEETDGPTLRHGLQGYTSRTCFCRDTLVTGRIQKGFVFGMSAFSGRVELVSRKVTSVCLSTVPASRHRR